MSAKRILAFALLALFFCLAITMGLWCAGAKRSAREKLEAELAAIRKEGYPVTLVELDAWYPEVPVGQNAAEVYEQAFARFSKGWLELWHKGSYVPSREERAKYLAENEEALKLLHKAAQFHQCRWPYYLARELKSGTLTSGDLLFGQVEPPHLIKLHQAFLLLGYEAKEHAMSNRPHEAAEAIIALVGVARSLDNEPLVESQATRSGLLRVSAQRLAEVLTMTELPRADLANLHACFDGLDNADGWIRAWAGERAMGSAAYDIARVEGRVRFRQGKGIVLGKPYRLSGLFDRDHLAYLQIERGNLAGYSEFFGKRLKAARDPTKSIGPVPKTCILAFLVYAKHPLYYDNVGRHIAAVRWAEVMVAIEGFRLAQGRLPERLDELVPAFLDRVPEDPFDGKPMRYQKLDVGYRVYSVGRDLKDDGGAEGDISYTVGR